MSKPRLNNRQKRKVEKWQSELGVRSRITRILDRTCGYRDAFLEWQKWVNQPNNKIAIVTYVTRLELTKGGRLRVDETEQVEVSYVEGCIECEDIPILPYLPPVRETVVDESLYPREERVEKPKKKRRQDLPLSLPLSDTEQRLLEISKSSGDRTVYSREELLSGKEGWYSLDQNRTVFLPAPIMTLLKDFNCSLEECEAIAMLAGVISPQDLLFWVEQIPQMRAQPEFTTFQEPVKRRQRAQKKAKDAITQSVKC